MMDKSAILHETASAAWASIWYAGKRVLVTGGTSGIGAGIARGFVDAIVDVLTAKCVSAMKHTGLSRLVIAGGVGANKQLRASLNAAAAKRKFKVYYPELEFCTDNGAMIAFAGAMRLERNPALAQRDYAFNVRPRWPLDELEAA